MLHQVAHREIGRIALPVVAVLLAELEPGHVRHRHALAVVAGAQENGANQLLVLPGKPPNRIVTRLRSSAVKARSMGL